jgi:hypothetical protein
MAVRRSAAPTDERSIHKAGAPIIPGAERLPPPPELRPAERRIWLDVTARLPPEWFTADNSPLLKEMCRHVVFADELAVDAEMVRERIAAVRAGSDHESEKMEAIEKLTKTLHQMLRSHTSQSRAVANLATKLRLTNQSRWQPLTADNQTRRSVDGPKPWENWSQ